MKILFLSFAGKSGYGGISKYNYYFVKGISKINNVEKIYIISRLNFFIKSKKIINNYYKNKFIFFLMCNLNLYKIIKSDIIVVSHINFLPMILIAFILRKKVVLMTYGLEIWGKKKNYLYAFLIKKIKFFINMREYTKKKLKKKYQLQANKFFILPNFFIKKKTENNLNLNSKNIVSIARLDSQEKNKGIDETLEALKFFKKIDFIYYVIGDGDDKQRLINKATDLKIIKHVKFLGKISDNSKNRILKICNILSMPGSDKTFDTYPGRFVFLEAAEYGLGIVATRPFKDEINVARDFINFKFVNPKKKFEIYKAILYFQKKRKRLDINFINYYSINKFYKKIKLIFNEIKLF